ncbi:hypothetical protein NMG60_11035594 [Bertholletia excelsa]
MYMYVYIQHHTRAAHRLRGRKCCQKLFKDQVLEPSMVVSIGPGKLYTDVKFKNDRIDPQPPVTDPLISWAEEAHWSMGGLSFNCLRLQGPMEGRATSSVPIIKKISSDSKSSSPCAPPAPLATKLRRFMALIDEEDGAEKEKEKEKCRRDDDVGVGKRRMPARKLSEDFDQAAKSSSGRSDTVSSRTRSQKCEQSDNGFENVNKLSSKDKRLACGAAKERAKMAEENDGSARSAPAGGTRTFQRLSTREVG